MPVTPLEPSGFRGFFSVAMFKKKGRQRRPESREEYMRMLYVVSNDGVRKMLGKISKYMKVLGKILALPVIRRN